MPSEVATRTFTASICNYSQVRGDLDTLGFAASKLWNVGRWVIDCVWSAIDYIPDEDELKSYLKKHERYADLQSQSSQKVLEELSEAFTSWYEQDDPDANPPGYRKHGDEHPRSTVTWKTQGFRVDTKYNRVRLSKGRNLKEHRSDYVLCEYELHTDEDVSLDDVESIQQVRVVWNGDEWELHFVCNVEIEVEDSLGENTAGIDLGISNVAAVSFGDETVLYPGGALKEDKHYYRQIEYSTEGENGPSNRSEQARTKKSRRATHYYHAVSLDIVEQCVERNVGTIAIGHPKHVREGSDWGRHANKRLHDWAFDTLIDLIEYKAEEHSITVKRVKEGKLRTSKTCCCCGEQTDSNRVERGLYVCEECGLVANADVNAAENMRLTVPPSSSPGDRGWNRSNGCLAQPAVRLFDKSTGRVARREQVS